MDVSSVSSAFLMFTGLEDEKPYLPLILTSVSEIENILRDGADKSDMRLIVLTASLANLRYTEMTASRERFKYTANGAVASAHDDSAQVNSARSMFQCFLTSSKDLVKDERFFFSGV